MNEKIQAILLKIVVELKKDNWKVAPDWELTLKSEGHVPMSKNIRVHGSMDDEEWTDDIDTTIDLKLASDDEITYFPEYTVYAHMYLQNVQGKDIAIKMDADVAFTNHDLADQKKISLAAKKISQFTEDHIEHEYGDYVSQSSEELQNYKLGGVDPDYDPER